MSITKKISLLFIASLILMSIIGLWIDDINTKRLDALIKDKYLKISNELFSHIEDPEQFENIITRYELKRVKNLSYKHLERLYFQQHTFGYIKIEKPSFDDEFIIHLVFLDEHIILKTPDVNNINDKIKLNALIFLDVFVLILIFLYILKLLWPLKKITQEINNFANGNLSSRIPIKSNDEIGTLAKTFNTMASRLEELIQTRQELLRDIGHELHTPIAKGKFAIEKIENKSQKEFLHKIFSDLEHLTNELIQLEKLNAFELTKSSFDAETLIIESLNRLYIDESKITLDLQEEFKINGDLEYLSIALKNLIDNALKYASSLPICIKTTAHEIHVINEGKKLNKKLAYYLKPFTQELTQRDGFGLGLSIVHKILQRHDFKLEYLHENKKNIFKIIIQ
ncbi:ArsS family sensor histidine kinase [Candidatus Marinarcus aquaticus]|uniref:histidine kinase n=1 Tax=Candidatus Marinarcus aquaticus TaxID=2044504 RepID=A0A4Q0XRC3_9BACT|nr:ArsS family sensor histidine kinase [Candidatus Marinarcus aquaticus]RXJ58134.1 histidine kinase [Candidatus Marinarcus aquaticus]